MKFSVVRLRKKWQQTWSEQKQTVCFCSSFWTPLFGLVTLWGGCWGGHLPCLGQVHSDFSVGRVMRCSPPAADRRLVRCQVCSQSTAVWSWFVCFWGTQAMPYRLPRNQLAPGVSCKQCKQGLVSPSLQHHRMYWCVWTQYTNSRLGHGYRWAYQITAS